MAFRENETPETESFSPSSIPPVNLAAFSCSVSLAVRFSVYFECILTFLYWGFVEFHLLLQDHKTLYILLIAIGFIHSFFKSCYEPIQSSASSRKILQKINWQTDLELSFSRQKFLARWKARSNIGLLIFSIWLAVYHWCFRE